VQNAPPILISFVILMIGKQYKYTAPRYAVYSTLPSLHTPSVQIFSSPPRSQTPSDCVSPLLPETKFHINTEPQTILEFRIF
jgi:hypothetical protein